MKPQNRPSRPTAVAEKGIRQTKFHYDDFITFSGKNINEALCKIFICPNIPFERKWVREDPSVGSDVKNRIAHGLYNVTTRLRVGPLGHIFHPMGYNIKYWSVSSSTGRPT